MSGGPGSSPSPHERLLALALRAWPRRARARDGAALVRTILDDVERRRGLARAWCVAAELATLVRVGVGMRARDALGAARAAGGGWRLDARAGARALARSPGYTLTVSLALAVGIGANAVVVGVARDALFTPPPFRDPGSLVFVWTTLGGEPGRFRVPAPDGAEIARRAPHLSRLAFVSHPSDGGIESLDGGSVEHVRFSAVTPDLFGVLGVEPALGRAFPTAAGADPSVILSHAAWVRVYGADTAVVGRTVRLDGRPVRVAGVMAPDFGIPMPPDVGMGAPADAWIPLPGPLDGFRRTDGRRLDQDADNTGAVIVRLGSGASLEVAAAEASRVATDLRAEIPSYDAAGLGLTVRPLHGDATAHLRGLMTLLLVGAAALLAVTCLNVSGVALARGAGRHDEVSLRASLGARPTQILRPSLLEAVLLTALGTAAALALGSVLSGAIATVLPGAGGVDPLALLPCAALCAGALSFASLAPALRAAGRSGSLLPAIGRATTGPARLREGLVGAQVALSVVVALTTGFLARTAQELYAAEPGFDPTGAMTFALSLREPARYRGPADRARLAWEAARALGEIPEVSAVGMTAHLPLAGVRWTQPYGLPGEGESAWDTNRADFLTVTSGYFAAIGVPLLDGRTFTPDEDLNEDRRVVVVDEKLARRIEPDGRAVGATLSLPVDGAIVQAEVVGVVGNVRHEELRRDGREAVYVPYRQEASRDVTFVVRTEGDPLALAPAIRRVVSELDPALPVHGLRTLASYVDDVVAPTRLAIALVGGFALLVLLSVAVGLYGVVALETSRRTREIGVRLAMGALPRRVVAGLLARGLRITGVGLIVGVAGSLAASRALAAALPGRSLADGTLWTAVLATVGAVALTASWLPARRASRLDPTEALRSG